MSPLRRSKNNEAPYQKADYSVPSYPIGCGSGDGDLFDLVYDQLVRQAFARPCYYLALAASIQAVGVRFASLFIWCSDCIRFTYSHRVALLFCREEVQCIVISCCHSYCGAGMHSRCRILRKELPFLADIRIPSALWSPSIPCIHKDHER